MERLSLVLGWTSTLAWGLSFYPQVISNYSRKSVSGLSLDFVALNVFGFLCYTIFNAAMLGSDTVREEYRERHDSDPLVQWNDLAFAGHALVLSSITVIQAVVYKRDTDQVVSKFNQRFLMLSIVAITSLSLLISFAPASSSLQVLDLIYLLSFIKLYISFAKYLPQAWLNYRRGSTIGWAIENIILDFTGGFLSLSQLFLDAQLSQDWSGVLSPKLALALLSLVFDLVFLFQHFILYRVIESGTGMAGEGVIGYGSIERD